MRDKAIGEIAEILFPLAEAVIATCAENPRSATPEEIRDAASRTGSEIILCRDVRVGAGAGARDGRCGRRGSGDGIDLRGGRSHAGVAESGDRVMRVIGRSEKAKVKGVGQESPTHTDLAERRDGSKEIRLAQPAAVLFLFRSADLGLHRGARRDFDSLRVLRQGRQHSALVRADLGQGNHEDDLLADARSLVSTRLTSPRRTFTR